MKRWNVPALNWLQLAKPKPVSDVEALYMLGQRDFGENYVQELVEKEKRSCLKIFAGICWGHLQSNKVKITSLHSFYLIPWC